jgi:hypothetical protein
MLPNKEWREKLNAIRLESEEIAKQKRFDFVPRDLSLFVLFKKFPEAFELLEKREGVDTESFYDELEAKYELIPFVIPTEDNDIYIPEKVEILPDVSFLTTLSKYFARDLYYSEEENLVITRLDKNKPRVVSLRVDNLSGKELICSGINFLMYQALIEIIADSARFSEQYWTEPMSKYLPQLTYYKENKDETTKQPQPKKGIITRIGEWFDKKLPSKPTNNNPSPG